MQSRLTKDRTVTLQKYVDMRKGLEQIAYDWQIEE